MTKKNVRTRILFVCTANAIRSQMAEAWARTLKPDSIDAYSAGVNPVAHISTRAIRVMQEVGVDISRQWPKGLDDWPGFAFDYVITLCEFADRVCPVFDPPTRVVHYAVPDPSGFMGQDEQVMMAFRKVREIVRQYVMSLPEALESSEHGQ